MKLQRDGGVRVINPHGHYYYHRCQENRYTLAPLEAAAIAESVFEAEGPTRQRTGYRTSPPVFLHSRWTKIQEKLQTNIVPLHPKTATIDDDSDDHGVPLQEAEGWRRTFLQRQQPHGSHHHLRHQETQVGQTVREASPASAQASILASK